MTNSDKRFPGQSPPPPSPAEQCADFNTEPPPLVTPYPIPSHLALPPTRLTQPCLVTYPCGLQLFFPNTPTRTEITQSPEHTLHHHPPPPAPAPAPD